jgi:serine/threonine protein kinase
MKPERWKEVERIYHAAMQCQADERSAYLEQACAADPALRAEVESLLQYAQQPAKFLDTPALEVAARGLAENLRAKSGDGREQAIGGSIEQYRIVAKIGAGGMGEIYRARDPRLGRDVAIKVLPSFFSADSDRLRRFEQEARAAAALNHPNILGRVSDGHA